MRLRTYNLRKGTLLYHGTSVKDTFEEGGFAPRGPAWFSTSEAVAREFVGWHEGPCPRVLVYRLTRNMPRLATVLSKDDLDVLLEGKAAIDAADMAEFVCGGPQRFLPGRYDYNGWYIPTNYPSGDDILLCSTDTLEFVERICL